MKSNLKHLFRKKNNQTILEELSHKKVLVSFSGGKDSSVVFDLIQKASEEFDIRFKTHGVIFLTNVYSNADAKEIVTYQFLIFFVHAYFLYLQYILHGFKR